MAVEDESFGGRLRRLRTEAGLSIAEFAERTKYSKGYISKIETGAKPPNPELARCCDEALGAS
ncbi:MAG TPA: helix-turn-helix transcriptional regulator, partial [Phytomonospora sp.]